MPVVLEEGQFEDWIRGPSQETADMMNPYVGARHLVSGGVGNVRNNKPLLDRVAIV
jgi:hypothetical protein